MLVLSVSCGALAAMGALVLAAPSAVAAPPPNPICVLLPALCPPTTPAPTAPPTTKAATTTVPAPTTTAARTTTTKTPTTTKKATSLSSSGRASVGAAGVSVTDLTPVAASADSPAPELAVSNTSTPPAVAPRAAALGTLSGPAGPPSRHSGLRTVLSLIALVFAAVAAAQLPASRRSPAS